ncbi:hypothetical protein ACWC2T_40940 [Streptomyces sp. NPDC001393]
MRPPRRIDAAAVSAAAFLAGIPVPRDDLDLLTRTMSRYEEVVAPLRSAALSDMEMPSTIDPRDGW